MAELLKKLGYGQVEPNRIQGRKQGRVVADIPVKPETVAALGDRIENGIFLSVVAGKGFEGNLKTAHLDLPTADSKEALLVYSEVKLYSEYKTIKDFALFTDTKGDLSLMRQSAIYNKQGEATATVVPRLLGLTLNDVFTTNQVELTDPTTLPAAGTELKLNEKGILSDTGTLDLVTATVVQATTMADGQLAVKVMISDLK